MVSWPAYEASLRQRGSLTVWFTDEAVEAWAAEPRTTRGGQPWYSALAILTALTLRAVFRLAYRQAEGLLGSVVDLLGLALRVPDHTTLSRRGAALEGPRPRRAGRAGGDAGGATAAAVGRRCRRRGRARAPAGGQHRPEAVWGGRVAGREARHAHAPRPAGAAPWRGGRHR